ncbi:MAG TPA: phosphoglycolate phosphatase [Burkholderiaceae bacterium]|nr:phosphoglycolate phosphatase [Burkholderiaceae bacterium]
MNLSEVRAAVIDLDGTMIDTLGDFVVAIGRMLDELGLPRVGREFIERSVGKGSEHLLHQTLIHVTGDAAAPGRWFDRAWESYQRHYLAINGEHSEVFPGVREGLQRLNDRGWPLACLTNKPTAFALPLLERKGLARHFRHVWGGDAFARKKPDPLPLIKACEALGTTPAHTLMVGDSANDAQAARAAGCPVVLVTYGYNHGEPVRTVDADGYLDRLDELLAD